MAPTSHRRSWTACWGATRNWRNVMTAAVNALKTTPTSSAACGTRRPWTLPNANTRSVAPPAPAPAPRATGAAEPNTPAAAPRERGAGAGPGEERGAAADPDEPAAPRRGDVSEASLPSPVLEEGGV